MEERGPTQGNPIEQNTSRTLSRAGVPSALNRIREAARKRKDERFTALYHHVYNVDRLRGAYFSLKRNAAAGVDGETWSRYGEYLEENLQDLSDRLQRGAYRAKPVVRAYVPKADGRQRPIGLPTLEDKVVQRATVEVLNAVYEEDFLGFSYGFRPGRSQHNALDGLKEVRIELRRRMHDPVPEQGAYLRAVLLGHMRYYGVPMNRRSLSAYRYQLQWLWWKTLKRRSQKHKLTGARMLRFVDTWFPKVRFYHPYPLERLHV